MVPQRSRDVLLATAANKPHTAPIVTHKMGKRKRGHANPMDVSRSGQRLRSWVGPPWGQFIIEEKRRLGIIMFMDTLERAFRTGGVMTPSFLKIKPTTAIESVWATAKMHLAKM
jgi:hypothetical protein